MSPYILPALPYAYAALEPFIDTETMTIHHSKHHQGYVDNLNKALIDTGAEHLDLLTLLQRSSTFSATLRNNAGGHYNHSLFWAILSPDAQHLPTGDLAIAIKETFGSVDQLKEDIQKAGLAQFGSGWAWLYLKKDGSLAVGATANQDNPLMDNAPIQGFPILAVDVWEHAYYLKYQNKRADYLQAFWSVLNWSAVEALYAEAKQVKLGE
ncbi:superoxide dismutase [Sphingobacterium sp. Mn56C]|uniref:superoxide dismutase n=1 Tax=Sphingobacterium sp. Mn56C TaxID=3395261 RepID=UPI003BC05084